MTAPEWAHPEWRAALAACLVGSAALLLAARWLAHRRLRRLLAGAPRLPARSDLALLLALALLGIALLGPRLGETTVRVPATGLDVVLLFDVSRSMDATDTPPSRLARARETAGAVLSGLRDGDRAALAAFAGHGALLTPLTPDPGALTELLPGLDSNLMTDTGSRLGRGLQASLEAFGDDRLRPRIVLVLSDGEGSAAVPDEVLAQLSHASVRVVNVALGTEGGSVIPTPGGPLRDSRGREVRSHRESRGLARIARATRGVLLLADAWGVVAPEALRHELRRGAHTIGAGLIERTLPVPRTAVPAVLALLLLLGETLPPGALRRLVARAARMRLALRGGSAALLLSLAPAPTPAQTLDTGTAGERLPSATWLLRVGVERAGDAQPAEATRAFLAAAARAQTPLEGALAYYDLGVAYLAQHKLAAARDAFFDALALDRHDRQARFNLEWTLRALEAKPPPPPPRPRPSENKEQDPQKPRPQPEPQDAAPKERMESKAPQSSRSNSNANARPWATSESLDPEELRHWLDAVTDDPRAALRGAARQGVPRRSHRDVRW